MTTDACWQSPADFEARIRIFTPEEGGRNHYALNGIRWDFIYTEPDDPPGITYCIWPLFCNAQGQPFGQNVPLPTDAWLPARMYIVWEKMRPVHERRIRNGVSFWCTEGTRRVAEGTVTDCRGLWRPKEGILGSEI